MPLLTNQQSRLLGGGRLPVPVPTYGAELLSDPGLEGSYIAGKAAILGQLGSAVFLQSADVHGGSKSQEMTAVAQNNQAHWTLNPPTAGAWYLASAWTKRTAGTSGTMRFAVTQSGKQTPWQAINWASYTQTVESWCSTSANATQVAIRESSAATFDTVLLDDGSLRQINLASMFSTRAFGSSYASAKARISVVGRMFAGVVGWLDSKAVPANFVVAMHNGANAMLIKFVAGTPTVLVDSAATYVTGAYIEVRRLTGTNTFQLFYNGAQVGTNQTIADVGIISNLLFGYMNTNVSNQVDSFFVAAT